MGEFSEVTMAFYLKSDAPDKVVAAFASAAITEQEQSRLPAPATGSMEQDIAEYFTEMDVTSLNEANPWRYDWAEWLGVSMFVWTCASSQLTWQEPLNLWHYSVRGSHKQPPLITFGSLRWLGPYIDPMYQQSLLIGHITWVSPRPYLIWARDGDLALEDLNPDDWEDI